MNFSILIVIFIAFAPSAFANYFKAAQQCSVRQGGCTRPIVIPPKKPKLPPIKLPYGVEEAPLAESNDRYAISAYTMQTLKHARKLGPNDRPGVASGPEGYGGISVRKRTPHLVANQNSMEVREVTFYQTKPTPRRRSTRRIVASAGQDQIAPGRQTLKRIAKRASVLLVTESDGIADRAGAQQKFGGNGKTSGGCIIGEMNKHLSRHVRKLVFTSATVHGNLPPRTRSARSTGSPQTKPDRPQAGEPGWK